MFRTLEYSSLEFVSNFVLQNSDFHRSCPPCGGLPPASSNRLVGYGQFRKEGSYVSFAEYFHLLKIVPGFGKLLLHK